jgi:glycosyltransferase involved in cell wall biosynthesis
MKVLIIPEAKTTASFSGPWNVMYYLSSELKKYAFISYYPSFQSSFGNKSLVDYGTQLHSIWSTTLRHDFDIAHFIISPGFINGTFPFAFFAREVGLPVVLNVHGIIHLEQIIARALLGSHPVKDLIDRTAIVPLCKRVSRIVVNSNFMFDRLIEWYNVEPEKVVVIPNGINLKLFASPTDLYENFILEGDPSVLFVSSSFSHVKGADILIKAITIVKKDLPHIKLHVVGNANCINPDLRSLIAEEGLETNISFHGRISQHRLPIYYRSADFCVIPSKSESFGIVLLEAMAASAPIIASDIPPFREILRDKTTGLLFRNEDPQELGKAILKMASDRNMRKRLSMNASRVAENYAWEKVAKKYLELYRSII